MSHLHHKVSALIDGELQGPSRKRALNHLRQCAECQHEVHATMALKHRLVGMPDAEPSADLFATLETEPATDHCLPGVASARPARSVRRILVGAGSATVVVLSLAYVVGAPETPVDAAVSPPVDEASANLAGGGTTSSLSDPAVDALMLAVGGGAAATMRSQRRTAATQPGPATESVASLAAPLGPPAGDDPAAVAVLREAAHRPDTMAYSLTRHVESIGAETTTAVAVRVVHVPEQGTSYQVVGSGSSSSAFVPAGDDSNSPSAEQARVSLLTDTYDIGLEGRQKVDGRAATVVSVGSGGDLVAEFWVDDATGVILRRDLYDRGVLVRTSSVTGLRTAAAGFIPHLPPELKQPPMAPISMSSAAQLGDAGWTCPSSLMSGWALTSLGRLDRAGNVMLAQYSDGLSSASIFEQRGTLDTARLAGYEHHVVAGADVYLRYGLPTLAVWQSGDLVYTAATDLPEQEVARLLARLPHETRADDGGLMTRVGTGLSRMAGFMNPVD